MTSRLQRTLLAALLACGFAGGTAFADATAGKVEARVDDATVLAKIKTSLLRSSEVEGLDVNVDVRDGVVTLSGSADTPNEKAAVERIAGSADGVKRVNNRIVIKQDNKADDAPAVPPLTPPGVDPPSLGKSIPGLTPSPPAN